MPAKRYYAANISYPLLDMRPCVGAFTSINDAVESSFALQENEGTNIVEVEVGDWFAVHGPGNFAMVDGPYKTREKADRERKKNIKTGDAPNDGFIAKVVRMVSSTRVVLERV